MVNSFLWFRFPVFANIVIKNMTNISSAYLNVLYHHKMATILLEDTETYGRYARKCK